MPWGYHLALDCKSCNKEKITDKKFIRMFVKHIIGVAEMVAHGEPQIKYLLPGTNNAGYSVLQMITTSNFTAHFIDSSGDAYVDLFSCKEFDIQKVAGTIKVMLEAEDMKATLLHRQA
jgi:S-adenosylmethionine/arginine decarboxylase-like enzyme